MGAAVIKEPDSDQTYAYTGRGFRHCTYCNLRIWRSRHWDVVVATELKENPGASITNTAADLYRSVVTDFGFSPTRLVLVEHYGPESYSDGKQENRFARILVDNAGNACWRHTTWEQLAHLLTR